MAERQRLANYGYPPQGYPLPKENESPSPATPQAKKKCKCRLHHNRKGQHRQYGNGGCLEGCLAALCCCCLLDECCCDPTIILN
ncbi:hypothetical protein GOP47_0010374 [Adiantum capillus-veneris]|uniref:Cysteine-rich transmembrane domain-containing protein n=1 Tax=Adiantum capillus-veneris TaxID=13818 RepID=A0A9D4UUL3_ADICA|nr:hypothetical protein GOP47_0010374 [Adiantum capillus-veneris]